MLVPLRWSTGDEHPTQTELISGRTFVPCDDSRGARFDAGIPGIAVHDLLTAGFSFVFCSLPFAGAGGVLAGPRARRLVGMPALRSQ